MSQLIAITLTAYITPDEIFGANIHKVGRCNSLSKGLECEFDNVTAAKDAATHAQKRSDRVDVFLHFAESNFVSMVFFKRELRYNTINACGVSTENPIVKDFIDHMTQTACN